MRGARQTEIFNNSLKYMPGGVNGPVRSFNFVKRGTSIVKKVLKGSKMYDVRRMNT